MKRILSIAALLLAASILMIPAATYYFETGRGARCAACHEMQTVYDQWRASSHRGIGCEKCHGNAWTTDPSFHWNNVQRAYSHMRGDLPEQIGFGNQFVQAIDEQCESCHRQEYAAWKSGPHSASYARIFLDKKHNTQNMLMDDCLRCHGMRYEGGVAGLVTPVDRTGPWRLTTPELAGKPSMPCVACHMVHREGRPMVKPGADGRAPGPSQEISRPSLAFFDRRTEQYVPVADLLIPAMLEGTRTVKMSRDQRQALCYQCHAPTVTMQVGSGDDRTGLGVHEGIGCLACHAEHGETTRASCANCHPKMSNCGLDVEKMDTTFASQGSQHNIHWVKCLDCHTKGVPAKKARNSATHLIGKQERGS
jgi:hypothetical protein